MPSSAVATEVVYPNCELIRYPNLKDPQCHTALTKVVSARHGAASGAWHIPGRHANTNKCSRRFSKQAYDDREVVTGSK